MSTALGLASDYEWRREQDLGRLHAEALEHRERELMTLHAEALQEQEKRAITFDQFSSLGLIAYSEPRRCISPIGTR